MFKALFLAFLTSWFLTSCGDPKDVQVKQIDNKQAEVQKLIEKGAKADSLQTELTDLKSKFSDLDALKASLESELNSKKELLNTLQTQATDFTEKLKAKQKELLDFEEKSKVLNENVKLLEQSLSDKTKLFENTIKEKDGLIQSQKKEFDDLQAKLNQLQKTGKEDIDKTLKEKDAQIATLKDEKQKLNKEFSNHILNSNKKINELTERIKVLEKTGANALEKLLE